MRIIQVSDTHLSTQYDYFASNTDAVAHWLLGEDATLIVNTGDVSMDGAGQVDDLVYAARWRDRFATETLTVPGNHDVGDLASIRPTQTVDDRRLAAWRETIGPDRWSVDRGGWRLIGLNAMLLGSGHPEEEVQFDWLAGVLDTNAPIALFLHKPLFIDHPDEGARGYWTVAPEPRMRILNLLNTANVRLVASGHLHCQRQFRHEGRAYVWSPSSSFVVGDSQEDLGGERVLGIVEHVFDGNEVTSRFIRPQGLEERLIEPVLNIIYPPLAKEPSVREDA